MQEQQNNSGSVEKVSELYLIKKCLEKDGIYYPNDENKDDLENNKDRLCVMFKNLKISTGIIFEPRYLSNSPADSSPADAERCSDLLDGTPVKIDINTGMIKKVEIGTEGGPGQLFCSVIATEHGWKLTRPLFGEDIINARYDFYTALNIARGYENCHLVEFIVKGDPSLNEKGMEIPKHNSKISLILSEGHVLLENGNLVGFLLYRNNKHNTSTWFISPNENLRNENFRKLFDETKYINNDAIIRERMDVPEAQLPDKTEKIWKVLDLRNKDYTEEGKDEFMAAMSAHNCFIIYKPLSNQSIFVNTPFGSRIKIDDSQLPSGKIKSLELSHEPKTFESRDNVLGALYSEEKI